MKSLRFAVLALPAVLSLAACEDPAKDAPKATVSSAAPKPATTGPTTPASTTTAVATNAPAAASGDAMPLDTAASTVGFVGSKVTGKHEGKFEKLSGSITLAGGKAEGGKITIEIETASVKSDSDKLDGHLKNKDFFEVDKFPKATFVSSEIKAGGEKGASHTITGELDLHGVKKTISFPATIKVEGDSVTGTAEFSINRKDFGIAYAGKADDLIRDDVLLKISLKAAKKK
jgi:polyisoprenoid-binding protein YceI